ncbi:MAG: ABC transporter permease [Pseudomonadota bacterium]
MNSLRLALAYLRFHWVRSIVLVLVVGMILAVPSATQILLASSERQLTARAEATPLVLGRRGSALDLTMNAIYFSDEHPEPLSMAEVDVIWDSNYATPIPLHTRFTSDGFRIVGTSIEYFSFRDLTLLEGRSLAVLGEAVIGAAVAADLGVGVGDGVVSSPENLFDLDGVYPLELKIVGVLARTNTPDDEAIFTDIKTAWVIEGIGHGHDDVLTGANGAENVQASASLLQFNRITPDNLDSFHFHGDPGGFPVTAILVDPYDLRGATILRGRYLDPDGRAQMVVPATVVRGLVDRIFRIKTLLDTVTLVIGVAALAAVALAIFLSYRLRGPEVKTAIKIGAGRGTIAQLLAVETAILLTGSIALAAILTFLVSRNADGWVAWLLATGT